MLNHNTLVVALGLAAIVFVAPVAAQDIGSVIDVTVTRGDLDGNDVLDRDDATLMFRILGGLDDPQVSGRDLDFNKDDKFDARDLFDLREFLNVVGAGFPASSETETALLGDANDDGRIDLADLISMLAWQFQGVHPVGPTEVADVNRDERFDVRDVAEVARLYFGDVKVVLGE